MASIADSIALKDSERVWPQHQAALTLLQARLSSPGVTIVRWLDLACGRGQIVSTLKENLSPEARAKVEYWAYDVDKNYAKETRKTADLLGFSKVETVVGDLRSFDQVLPAGVLFDFVTLTNTVHEIEPIQLAGIFVGCIRRLHDTGTLFVYDMERIQPPELGAIPWARDNIRSVVHEMLVALGCNDYRPEVGLWHHRTCTAWNVQLQRQHLHVSTEDLEKRSETAIGTIETVVIDMLRQRYAQCRKSLETFTLCGAETAQEQEDKEHLLYELWGLIRALEQQ